MSDGFYVLQDYRFVYVNEAFERLLGSRSGELLGRRFDDFVHPEEREDALQRYKRRIVGEKVIKRIEAGTLVPSIELARRLERVLGVKLLEPVAELEEEEEMGGRERFQLTLGDIAELRED